MLSKHWVINFEAAVLCVSLCAIHIPQGGDVRLFPMSGSKGSSSKVTGSTASIFSKAFTGSGSKQDKGLRQDQPNSFGKYIKYCTGASELGIDVATDGY